MVVGAQKRAGRREAVCARVAEFRFGRGGIMTLTETIRRGKPAPLLENRAQTRRGKSCRRSFPPAMPRRWRRICSRANGLGASG